MLVPQPDWKISATAPPVSGVTEIAPVRRTISVSPSSLTRPATVVPRIDAVALGRFTFIASGLDDAILPDMNLKAPLVTVAEKDGSRSPEGS